MKKLLLVFTVLVVLLSLSACTQRTTTAAGSWDPYRRPITIITHVAPGGGMDVATRKFIEVARNYTDATFVVENRVGGGTLIASDAVLGMPADGYTIFGAAMSNVASVIALDRNRDHYIFGYEWIAQIQRDPGSINITTEQRDSGLTFLSLIEDAKALNEIGQRQNWVGPSVGGTKHIDAMVIWETIGIEAQWIPFDSGPLAAAALLGGQGIAQSGNPFDTIGRDLWVAAVAAPYRLPGFEDSPTFAELGFPELNEIHMWRGYAVRRGTPPEMISWFQDLVSKITVNQDWIDFNTGNAITPVAIFTEEFTETIERTIAENEYYLRKLGLLYEEDMAVQLGVFMNPLFQILLFAVFMGLVFAVIRLFKKLKPYTGQLLVLAGIFWIGLLSFIISFSFPPPSGLMASNTDASTIPRVWFYALIPSMVFALIPIFSGKETPHEKWGGGLKNVWIILAALVVSVILFQFIGYYISSALFVVITLWILGVRKKIQLIALPLGWVAFSYIVFARVLFVRLPVGSIFSGLFY
ncbi:MAG: tripartite tricarboxylate transporter substrate-binding protein [Treponema sp.]|nr:tripartite tricarboxylate transporter substrate-binding protein [Treponema sp.]